MKAELENESIWKKIRYGPIRAWNRWGWHRRDLRWAWQRVRRGYSDLDLWNTDHWLSQTLGTMLVQLADITHGSPVDFDFEQWVSEMRFSGEALLTYARMDIVDDDYMATHEQKIFDAKHALHWVGTNLPGLWD